MALGAVWYRAWKRTAQRGYGPFREQPIGKARFSRRALFAGVPMYPIAAAPSVQRCTKRTPLAAVNQLHQAASTDDHRRLGLSNLLPAGIVFALYQLGFGGALYVVLRGDPLDAALCFGPVAISIALAMTSQLDRKQYIARLLAAALFLPIGLLFWASSHPAGGWMLVVLAAAHVAAFVLAIAWLARLATHIDAARGVAAVGASRLAARIDSLQRFANGHFRLARQGAEHVWTVELLANAQSGRRHRMTLTLDAAGGRVAIKEFLSADGAVPQSAQERDMRAAAEPYFDPTRPDAQAVWNRTRQSSMIDPDRFVATAVRFDGDEVRFDYPPGIPVDDDAVIILFAVLVTRSGYAWAPRLFD